MPSSDQSRLSAAIELQSGTRVEETMKVTRKLEDYILTHCPEVELLSTSTGSNDESSIAAMFSESGTNLINLNMRLSDVEKRKRSDVDVSEQIRQFIGTLPEVITYTVTTGGVVFGGTSTVDVEIFGYDFDKTNALAAQVETSLKGLKGARDVSVSRDKDKAELQVVLDKEKLALHNLNSATVSTYVRNRINGATVGLLREDGEEYDIVVRLEETYRNTLSDVEELTIPTPTGGKIKLKELGEVKELWSPPNIEHKRRERLVTVKVTPVGVPLGTLAKQIQAEVDKLDIPSGIIVNVGGAYEDQQESFADIGLLLLAVMVLVYLAMASQFESYSKPFVIMFSVPFAFTGVAVALFITGTSLSMIAAIGLVMLVGIVVKNGVVLVDFINLMRDRGLELSEAIAVAGKSRLRPVIMTALTSILGMLPMAMGIGEGSETWAPLGVTIVGGLFVSTMVTMILIPVLYAVFARRGERDKQQAVRKKFIFMDK